MKIINVYFVSNINYTLKMGIFSSMVYITFTISILAIVAIYIYIYCHVLKYNCFRMNEIYF